MSAPRVRDEAPVSFLSRIGGRRPEPEPFGEGRFERELRAVARNLTAVLNSRKGSGSVVPDFGLGDYEGTRGAEGGYEPHVATGEILAILVPEIRAQVARYEPRIADPRVAVLGRDRDLRAIFTVTGLVSGRPARFRVALHTVFRGVEVEAEPVGPEGA